ncbi:MAG: hypothetical protein DRG66_05890, partial [Deltaproteobacteria bacterium]
IIGIVERLWLRSDSTELVEVSNRLTFNIIRNQQPLGPEQLEAEGRNHKTLNETNITSSQTAVY